MKNKPIKTSSTLLHEDFCFNNPKKKENYHPRIKIVQVDLDQFNKNNKQLSSPQVQRKTINVTNKNNRPSSQRKKEEKKSVAPLHIKTPSIKDDIRKRNCRSLVKPQIYSTPKKRKPKGDIKRKEKLKQTMTPFINNANSNCVLTTNFTESKTEKKKSKTKNKRVCDTSLSTIQHLRNIFLTSTLKKTIIIDERGNNNLNIKQNVNRDNNMVLYRKTFCNSIKVNVPLFDDLSNKNIKKNSESDKSTIIEPLESNDENDDLRYEALVNLLNHNMLQDKNSQNEINDLYHHDSLLFSKSHFDIFTQKDRDEINCIKPNDDNNKGKNKDSKADLLSNNSFLDSYFQDDLFHSFIKASSIRGCHYTETPSFNYSTTIRNQTDSNININYDQTECCDDLVMNPSMSSYVTQPYLFNPRLLLKKPQSRNNEIQFKKEDLNKKCCIS